MRIAKPCPVIWCDHTISVYIGIPETSGGSFFLVDTLGEILIISDGGICLLYLRLTVPEAFDLISEEGRDRPANLIARDRVTRTESSGGSVEVLATFRNFHSLVIVVCTIGCGTCV